jgi:glycosyltransferase involved in cell wall biosynthesis
MLENATSIPMVAVCHGTPQFIGQYRSEYREPDLGRVIEESRQQLVDALGGIPVVCNSYQAQREWEFQNSRVIWHGFDPSEFQLTDYSGGVLSLGRAIRERPYYRGYDIFKTVSEKLVASEKPEHHYVRKPGLFTPGHEAYARLKFQAYRESIRKYSVYFNPTIRSPMPRSRGEAMMSGLVTVSSANHDVQLFIKNGWNGFYSDSADELAEYISFLMRNRAALGQMGRRSRTTAADVFNHDRYLNAWQTLMSDIIG